MIRTILIFLANLALPFVLFALRNWAWRLWIAHRKHKNPENVNIPKMHPKRALLFIFYGLLLFFGLMVAQRLLEDAPSPRHPRQSDKVIDY